MKNYKYLVPIVLVLFLVLSVYKLNTDRLANQKKYDKCVAEAREFRMQDVQIDAEKKYLEACKLKPSLDLYLEICEFYVEINQLEQAISFGEKMISRYPKKVEAYELVLDMYISDEDYGACFALADTYNKRKLSGGNFEEKLATVEYEYFLSKKYDSVSVFSGGYCPVSLNGMWGFVSAKGGRTVETEFLKVGAFCDDLAPVIDKDNNAYFIDSEGNKKFVVTNVKNVVELGLMEDGIFPLFNGKTWAFYNKEGKKLFGDYTNVSSMGNGYAAVEKNGKWSLIDSKGNDLTGKTYSSVVMDEKTVICRNGRIFVEKNGKYSMIDTKGDVHSKQEYEDVHIFNNSTYAAVKIDGKWGFVDADGNIVIKPQYDSARSFSNQLAAVQIDGFWGFIDLDGKMVIEPQFMSVKDFSDKGTVFVYKSNCWELLKLYKYNY